MARRRPPPHPNPRRLVPSLNPVHTCDKVEFNTVDFVESRLLPKPATNRQQSRLLLYTFNFVADAVDSVASVYGAKATRSTFNKVDRVEFNFVASVYRAYWNPKLATAANDMLF